MIFSEGLVCPEGPVALADGSWLCVQGEPVGAVTHISSDGNAHRVLAVTGRPNGLAVDAGGNIWVAESRTPSLLKMSMDGNVQVMLLSCGDEKFLFPNDLCFGPDGFLYLTDSGILIDNFAPNGKVREDYNAAVCDGRVYRINPENMHIEKLDTGIRFTNGIAFGTDNYLYANETLTGNIYRYKQTGSGFGQRELFGNVIDPEAAPGYKGPDGMAFDKDHNLYVAVFGQKDITVLSREGKVLRRLATSGKNPTNLAFAQDGQSFIHVTEYEQSAIERLDTGSEGLPLYS